MSLAQRLERARNAVARLERQIGAATCAEVGHKWRHIGGRNCGCEFADSAWGQCSVPVYECAKCGDCDYGDNAEANEKQAACASEDAATHPTPTSGSA